MLEFSFAEVEAVLARQFFIASAKRTAFRSRIKAIQKYGVPHQAKSGRGIPQTFTGDQLLQLAIALELTCCGLAPQLAARIVRRSWWSQHPLVVGAFEELQSSDQDAGEQTFNLDWAWQVYVDELSDLMERPTYAQQLAWLRCVTVGDLWQMTRIDAREGRTRNLSRTVIINTAAFFLLFAEALATEAGIHIDSLVSEYLEQEPVLSTFAKVEIAKTEYEVSRLLDAIAPRKNLRAVEVDLSPIERIRDECRGTQSEIRALGLLISPDARFELAWILTPPRERKYNLKQTGEVLDQRRSGQAELFEFGLIEEASGDAFIEPTLTPLGKAYLARFSWYEENADVDPEA